MYATNYFENKMLNLLRGADITAPQAVYLALFHTNPTDTGAAGQEASYSGYTRKVIEFSAPAETDGTPDSMYTENTNEIGYAEAPSDAGVVNYIAIFDAQSGGNMLLYCELSNPLNVVAGIAPVFRTSSIRWTWNGVFSNAVKTGIMNTLRGTTLTGITPWVALCSGDIEASGAEFRGGNYARFRIEFSAPQQDTSTGAAKVSNTALVLSNVATANWGSLTHVAIMDAQNDGTIFAVIQLPNAFSINTNMTVGFNIGTFQLSLN